MCYLWKKALWEYPVGTRGCFYCRKDDHKVRYFHTIMDRGREGKQVATNGLKYDAPNKRRFYALQTKEENPDEDEVMVSPYISLVL